MTTFRRAATALLVAAALSAPTGAAHAGDIVDTAAKAGKFNTLIAAAKAAGLVGALKGKGPITVFAPTDAAFAKLPKGTVESLLKPENKDQLVGILTYHVVGRKLTSGMLPHRAIHVKPLNTAYRLQVKAGRNSVTVDKANVIAADIKASNGVIHVIDTVLLPKRKAAKLRSKQHH